MATRIGPGAFDKDFRTDPDGAGRGALRGRDAVLSGGFPKPIPARFRPDDQQRRRPVRAFLVKSGSPEMPWRASSVMPSSILANRETAIVPGFVVCSRSGDIM